MKIGITGCAGRMGRILCAEIISGQWHGMSLAGGTARSPASAGMTDIWVTDSIGELLKKSDMVIDFTRPDATLNHARAAAAANVPMVIGTTGLSPAEESDLATITKNIPVVYAANMSVGVNLLNALVEQAARQLGMDFDIEISETHHRHKIDAPSGTALALGRAAARGRDIDLDSHKLIDRSGKRPPGDIGFSVSRGGDVVGEHTVSFYGIGERVELSHRATDRALFARGALRAAQWLGGQKPGLYSMRDVLGI